MKTYYHTTRDIPTEQDENLRWDIEADATGIDRSRCLIRLLSQDWMNDNLKAYRAVKYLEGAAFLFEVLDWENRTFRLVLTDESLDLSPDWARGTFDDPQECEDWFEALGDDLEEEGWDEETGFDE